MSSRYDEMSKVELVAELLKATTSRIDAPHAAIIQELETYREETRVQTSQLIESQRLLEQSRDRYADLYETAPVAYLTLDAEGIVRDINLTGCQLLAQDRQRVLNFPFVRFVTQACRRSWLEKLNAWGAGSVDDLACEVTMLTGSGWSIVEAIARPVEIDGGKLFRVALVDQTTARRAEQEVRQANVRLEDRVIERTQALEVAVGELRTADRRKNEFLAMLGHELRNPLASLANGLAILRMTESPIEEQTLGIMDRQMGNISRLLNDLLDVSRVTLGKVKLQRKVHDVNQIVGAAAASCHDVVLAHRHAFQVIRADQPCLAKCDYGRVEQMIVNLILNATKYTDDGGTVTLAVKRDDHEVQVEVTDSGCGMAPETSRTVFELFSQASSTIDRSEGGLGIGLTMVKGLAEMQGGRVEAYSRGVGQGSRFSFWLPLCDPAPEATLGLASDVEAERQLSIVVVDDNVDAAKLLRMLLIHLGHQVEIFHDGLAGLEGILRSQPDVAIIDIGLPGLNGFELARRVRQEIPPAELRLIAISGYGSDEDLQRSKDAGIDKHLTKPVPLDTLRGTLRSVFLSHVSP